MNGGHLEIFRAGTHRTAAGSVFTIGEAELAEAATAYDPKVSEAPLVVGHPKLNAPAYGWVQRLEANHGTLNAHPHQVDPAFAELVALGRFKKISAAFYTPSSPHNPKPGVYYLRHVGLLGATPPVVKGLRDAEFADESDDIVEFSVPTDGINAGLWRGLREWILSKFGAEDADRAVPNWDVQPLEREAVRESLPDTTPAPAFAEGSQGAVMDPKALAEREEALAKKEAELASKEADVAKREVEFSERAAAEVKQRAIVELAEFVETLVKGGKVLPVDKAPLVAALSGVQADAVVEFAEEDGKSVTKPAGDWLKAWLGRLPVQVDFAERSAAGAGPDANDPEALAHAARAYQDAEAKAGRTIRTSDAVAHVRGTR